MSHAKFLDRFGHLVLLTGSTWAIGGGWWALVVWCVVNLTLSYGSEWFDRD